MRRWLRELRASLDSIVESFARDTRLRLYGDPKTVGDLGIAAAKAGLTVNEVEAAVRVYRRAEWLELDHLSLAGVYRDIDTLTKVRAAHTEYQSTKDLHELARTMNTLLGVKP